MEYSGMSYVHMQTAKKQLKPFLTNHIMEENKIKAQFFAMYLCQEVYTSLRKDGQLLKRRNRG